MKAQVLIIKGAKAHLQAAYKSLTGQNGVLKLTIYKFGTRYRMMIGGFLSIDEVAAIMNDTTLKISKAI